MGYSTFDRRRAQIPETIRAAPISSMIEALRRMAQADASRWGLWSPVAIGAGAIVYFHLGSEPPPFAGLILAAVALALVFAFKRIRPLAFALVGFSVGFIAAELRTFLVSAPILEREIDFALIEGRLGSIEDSARQKRLIFLDPTIKGVSPENTPEKIRVSWRGRNFTAEPGDIVRLRASLSPPPRPASPGGFDFGRHLYFQGIGAVGFSVSAPEILPEAEPPLGARIAARIESIRVTLARRIVEKAPGDGGAIVAAVVTGKRGFISETAENIFRDSGLAHLLSISGLHMGLATGIIFFTLRAGLALIEPIALRWNIKKIAALAAIASGAAYLFISGAAWPAQRAYIMSSIFFIAILVDRRAISLRNVMIAATIIILLTPEAVLHPGFQMSFAAVTALIASYEWASSRVDPDRSYSWLAKFKRYTLGIVATDTISAFATAPYSLYHFSRTANFGLAANLISIPLMAFCVMPAAILAVLFMPTGHDGPIWRFAAAGVEVMLTLGRWTTDLPGAVTVFPKGPASALGVMTVGGLWLCLMRAPWRLAGLAAIPVSMVLVALTPHPILFVSDGGDNVGVYINDRKAATFAVFDRRRGRFDSELWMEQSGIDSFRNKTARLAAFAPCDENGCVLVNSQKIIAISSDSAGLATDCQRADLVIALYFAQRRAREHCRATLLDKGDAWRSGAHAIYMDETGFRIEDAARLRGRRPWTSPEAAR